MRVHSDFFLYRSGVYRYSGSGSQQRTGYHSVRIVGWGVDSSQRTPIKYWVRLVFEMLDCKSITVTCTLVGGQFLGTSMG